MSARQYLIDARHTKRLTQEQVAAMVGIHQAAYSNIESGKRTPSAKLAKKIAAVLELDWTCFYDKTA